MNDIVSKSRFFMWRTLFALAHADNIVTEEEITFMANALEDINFTKSQADILKSDIVIPQNAEEMFSSITNEKDRLEFFDFARNFVWVDGHFVSEEQAIMVKLMEKHVGETNVDSLVGGVSMELEKDSAGEGGYTIDEIPKGGLGLISIIKSFRSRFL